MNELVNPEGGLLEPPASVQRATVRGEPLLELPRDLYIPPDALEVFLETFQGPLDLLLYLIRRQNLDVLDIPIAAITRQYMEYVELMKDLHLELAAEYLVMAAVLAEIKSRMLLPRPVGAESEETDPRAELVRRLQEYERYQVAGEDINSLSRLGRDVFSVSVAAPEVQASRRREPEVTLQDLLTALADVMARADMFTHHHIQRDVLSVRERMTMTLERLSAATFTDFRSLLNPEEGRRGVVVTFLAILELIKASLVELVQAEAFAPIYLRARA